MPPTSAAEEIIEKKAGSPVAMSCLILSVVAIIGAIVFQVMEISEYRRNPLKDPNDPAGRQLKADRDSFHQKVSDILEKKAPGGAESAGLDEGKPEDVKAPAKEPEGTAESKAEKTAEEKADEKAEEKDADGGKAEEKPDEKTGDAEK